jgi:hypothetical protein
MLLAAEFLVCAAQENLAMSQVDNTSPREIVREWLETAEQSGQLDSYEAKRGETRCSWPQPLELLVDGEVVYVQARDVSEGGIGLVAKRDLHLDQHVQVRRGPSEPWVKCRVAHVTRTIGAFKVGVELTFDFD